MSDYANDWVGQTLSGGRYRVDAKLGEGGMGFVYKVWDRNLDTDLVVKAPRKSMLDDPEFASRFALEIRSLVKLTHPNIVKVSDVGEHEAVPFAVMQYLSGGTLDERLDFGRDGLPLPAPASTVAGWLPGIAAALDFIHGKGYIHRDVKPANILFDSHGHPYLSDFGVAKVLSDVEAVTSKKGQSGLTGAGIVLGTPDYMAPELIMGNTFDGRVDQYALAATAYEILCGRKPFVGENPTAVLVRQTTLEPPPMEELPAPAGAAISRVIMKALAKKPEGRYLSCVDFANALLPALAKAGSGRHVVDRLNCPTCGVGFAIPSGIDNYRGKKTKCRACGVPFRIAMDGLSLLPVDQNDGQTPSGGVEIPAAARAHQATMKLDAMPGPSRPAQARTERLEAMPAPAPARAGGTMKLDAMPAPAPARAGGTMKLDAMPNPAPAPARAQGTMKLEAMPRIDISEPTDSLDLRDDEPQGKSILPWLIAAGGVAAAAVILVVALAMRPSREPAVGLVTSLDPPMVKPSPKPKPQIPTNPTPPPAPAPTVAPQPIPRPKPSIAEPPPPAPVEAPVTPEPALVAEKQPEPQPEPEFPPDPPPLPKNAQPKGGFELRMILANPKGFVDQTVVPSDLLMVDASAGHGSPVLPVNTKNGSYQNLPTPGGFRIVLEPEVHDQLRNQLNARTLVAGWYPAMMGMKIVRDPRQPGGFVGRVEWLELLYYIDPRPIAGRLRIFKEVYSVVHLASPSPSVGWSSNFKQWQDRIQVKTTNIRNQYDKEGKPPVYGVMGKQAINPAGQGFVFHQWIKKHFPQ